MNTKTWGTLTILILLILSLAQVGCGGSDEANASTGESGDAENQTASNSPDAGDKDGDEDEEAKEEAVPVELAELSLGPIESVLRFSSNLEAESSVQVFSQAKRLVTDLLVEEGDRVRKDQVLLRLQDDEQRSALAKTQSQLEKEQREFEQQKRLFEQKLISQQMFNDATYELEQLKISFEDAQRELTYTEVRAPIGGTITGRQVNLGDQVQIGQHLFDLVDFDSIVARVYVPERYLHQLRTGLAARLSSQSTDEFHRVSVKRISPIVDPKSGTVKVTVSVGGLAGMRPGMYVDVDLVVATHAEAVLVPKRAVIYDNDQMYVYMVDPEAEEEGKRVKRVFIEPSLIDKYHIEPIDGLAVGDRIVVAGQAGLKEGALITVPGDEEESDDTASEDAEDEGVEVTERARL